MHFECDVQFHDPKVLGFVFFLLHSNTSLPGLLIISPQECRSLHFPSNTVEMPNTDALQYLMYKGTRGALANLKDGLDETLDREYSRISDKGASPL